MKLFLIYFLLIIDISGQSLWRKLNGPEGSTITALITKGDTLLAGTGLFKALIYYSTNRGQNWERAAFKTTYPTHMSRINAFVFSEDGGIIAADEDNGLYKSFDLIHWENILFNNKEYNSLGKDAIGNLYAGTDDGKIFRSSDNGINWGIMNSGTTSSIWSFVLTKDSTLYAGTGTNLLKKPFNSDTWIPINFQDQFFSDIFLDSLDNIYVYTGNGFIFLSTDGGSTWSTNYASGFMYGNIMYRCIYNNRLIGAFSDQTSFLGSGWGIALSDDQGVTWRWNNNGLPPKFDAADRLVKSGNDTYVGTDAAGVFKSTDFGDSWFSANNGIYAANTVGISFDNEGSIYAACWSNGIYKSTDKGQTWELKNVGFTTSYIYSIISDDNGILLAGTDHGAFRSTNKGESWVQITSMFFFGFYKDNLNRIYGLSYGSGVYRTTNQGSTWTRIDNGFINGYVFGFAIDSSNNIYAGTRSGYIYKSTNDGSSWSNVYQGGVSNSALSSIAIAPNGTIFATDIKEGLLRSTDSGQNWNLLLADNSSPQAYPVNVDKNGVVYVASDTSNKFYSSTDNGDTWNDITGNMYPISVNDIKFDKDGNLYLATDESIWTNSNNSLPIEISSFIASLKENNVTLKWNTSTEINNLGFNIERKSNDSINWQNIAFIKGAGSSSTPNKYSYINSNLLPGRYNYRLRQIDVNGSYKYYSLAAEIIVNNPTVFSIEQNYPNPFNPTTEIRYSIASTSLVSLKVYDVLGKEAGTLVNETKQPGSYTVLFNAKELSSGVYFYRLEAGDFTSIKKMIILK